MNSISLTILVKMKLVTIMQNLYYIHVISRSSNIRLNELFQIAKCSSVPTCNCFKYTPLHSTPKAQTGTQREAKKWILNVTRKRYFSCNILLQLCWEEGSYKLLSVLQMLKLGSSTANSLHGVGRRCLNATEFCFKAKARARKVQKHFTGI